MAGFLAGWLENMIMNTPFVGGFRLEVPVRFRKKLATEAEIRNLYKTIGN